MLPGDREWAAAHDRYLQPPEYDGCEDCDCEDAETPATLYECSDGCCREVCACKCHNIPHDPNEDGDADRDEPDYGHHYYGENG